MSTEDFQPMTSLMCSVGQQIASWRYDLTSRHVLSPAEFKTEADHRAHTLIHEGITRLYPGIPVLSEESPQPLHERPHSYWLIDPIDGTASWYHGFAGFVTQAAFIHAGEPVFGIVHAPLLHKTWIALKGHGAQLNGTRLTRLQYSQRLVITDNTPEPQGVTKFFCERLPATGYFESGSLGLKAALVADGTADLFIKDVIVRDWDFAPAAVILREVGGFLALTTGKPYPFSGSFEKYDGIVVARDGALFEQAIALFTQYRHNS